jgi:putative inorganic carbon (HCO3(-)) transporter
VRDVLILFLVLAGSIAALRRPWIGVMVWTWLSIMNPHRYTWGWSYVAPVAAIAAGSTLIGTLMTKDRSSPFKSSAVVLLALFMVWLTLSWLFGLDPAGDYPQWDKVFKIDLMILVALALLHTKQHIFALAWVVAGSLALLGAKGGLFTLVNGGSYRVWGPPGSFIEDNNEFALALVMTIPLLRFLQMQLKSPWAVHAMTVLMFMCFAAGLGSYSRGSMLAMAAMLVLFWWRSKSRLGGGLLIVVAGAALLAFMPEGWTERMSTISHYDADRSALGRISAWWNAWNLAWHYPLGVGFDAARPELFKLYSPYPDYVHAAHSIYFQVLGNHGFIGLALFLAMGVVTWFAAGWLRRHGDAAQTTWCADLGSMCQVSMLGYAVGGAFLSLSYFDLPYDIMVLVVLTRAWVKSKGWEREPVYAPGWRTLPGLAVRQE